MKIFRIAAMAAAITLFCVNASVAGTIFEGWGDNPNAAMKEALGMAENNSTARCLCKGWGPNLERDCRQGLGGFFCQACGSNHAGSCINKSDLERIKKSLGIE